MNEMIVGAVGAVIGWAFTLLYIRGKLGQFPLYNRIISWFYTDSSSNSLDGAEEFLSSIREAIVDQILNKQPQLFDAIAKQRMILSNQTREPVAIFLSTSTFKELLHGAFIGANRAGEVNSLYEVIRGLDMPVGHLGVLPIYVTELLIDAPVFVAGGINWKI